MKFWQPHIYQNYKHNRSVCLHICLRVCLRVCLCVCLSFHPWLQQPAGTSSDQHDTTVGDKAGRTERQFPAEDLARVLSTGGSQ